MKIRNTLPPDIMAFLPTNELEYRNLPKRGAAYDYKSLRIYEHVKGNQSYKTKLDRFVALLTKKQVQKAKLLGMKLPRDLSQLKAATRILIHSFAHIASIPRRYEYIGISLQKKNYFGDNAEFKTIPYLGITTCLNLMTHPDFGSEEAPIKKITGNTQNELRTRLQPSSEFLDDLTKAGLVFPGHPYGFEKSRTKKDHPLLSVKTKIIEPSSSDKIKFKIEELKRDLNTDEEFLPVLNEKLKRLQIAFNLPNYQAYLDSWDFSLQKSKLRHMSGNQLYRRFSEIDGSGGRLYGHWIQQCPKVLRKHITFFGRETIELDFGSMQLRLLYALANAETPIGDLYEVAGKPRDWMKHVFTTSVGAASQKQALSALRGEMRKAAPQLLNKAEPYFNEFWQMHPAPFELLFKERTWSVLQYWDSVIALRTLSLLLQENITCIPIHDSFIVQRRFEDHLKNAMTAAFNSVFPGVQPIIN